MSGWLCLVFAGSLLGCASAPDAEPENLSAHSPSPAAEPAPRTAPSTTAPLDKHGASFHDTRAPIPVQAAPGPWPEGGEQSCPPEMVRVPGRSGPFCIHRYEVTFSGELGHLDQGRGFPDGSTQGVIRSDASLVPSVRISWYQAFAACVSIGAHLCTSTEWLDACTGPEGRSWPTPDGSLESGACGVGEGRSGTNLPPLSGGAFPNCHTPEGVYNLLGNTWEWVDPGMKAPDGTPLIDKRGAARYTFDAPRCTFSAIGSHEPSIEGTISFRCCAPLGYRP
jgi:formylglycine-generating enzyme required for sulfatase activity